jgi:homoserine dehydrogenase
MTSPLKVGIAGLGTVGGSVARLLQEQSAVLARRCHRPLQVVAVSARDRNRKRKTPLDHLEWLEDPRQMIGHPDIDVVVELIGGADGVAHDLCTGALQAGQHVVTANKSLLARHGHTLAALAESRGVTLAFEAAVAGGVPIVKTLREGVAANTIERFYGILNGTCNYILTTMAKTGAPFAAALKEAQTLGYAEADPAFDIDGVDAAHKLAILASIAFGTQVNFAGVYCEGIRQICREDVTAAASLGFVIKLLAMAERTADGVIQSVYPCLVPKDRPIAHVDDVFNAIMLKGDYVGEMFMQGRGAGGNPTASAVVADLIDLANARQTRPFGTAAAELESLPGLPITRREGHYYLRFQVRDRAGVVADITGALGREGISIRTLTQRDESHSGGSVPMMLTTHRCREQAVQQALAALAPADYLEEPPHLIRIEYL